MAFRRSTAFGHVTGPIFFDNLACSANDEILLDCPHSVIHHCDHSQDVGVQCFGMTVTEE